MTFRHVAMAGAACLAPVASRAQDRPTDSVMYVLSQDSRLEVKTGKAGLFGFAGHSHLVRARAFSGRVVYYPSAPADSRVEVSVGTDSLEVLTPPDTAEIRKVTEAMRGEVLHVDQYPLITFVSTAVAPTPEGFHVEGQLTIAGQTRDVGAELTVAVGRDTLRANGSFSVKQTDFGIRPYRGGPANTVRVADRVTLTIEVVGIRPE
ncbi:MAG TPA: YceI family protein [Gemmatimonadales bacterium]|nr:YceI family protein [Gemmatimonadales bacterium]